MDRGRWCGEMFVKKIIGAGGILMPEYRRVVESLDRGGTARLFIVGL